MSVQITPRAYDTRLGNLTAKSVLALLADQVNDDGYGWPSVKRIAEKTEIQPRTVLRIVQVFETIGVLERTTHATHAGRMVPAFQLHLERLGGDLRGEFAEAYAVAQGKISAKCRRDTVENEGASVSETHQCVAETRRCVAETHPPDPLIGGTAKEPLGTSPLIPQRGTGDLFASNCVPIDTVDRVTDGLMRMCGFVSDRLRKRLRAVVAVEAEKGEAPQTIVLEMAAAWKQQNENGHLLRVKLGPAKFFELGYWKDANSWFWDHERVDRSREARAGSW